MFRVQLLAMCRGEVLSVNAQLISKCLWNGWNWYRGVKEIASTSPFVLWIMMLVKENPNKAKSIFSYISPFFTFLLLAFIVCSLNVYLITSNKYKKKSSFDLCRISFRFSGFVGIFWFYFCGSTLAKGFLKTVFSNFCQKNCKNIFYKNLFYNK